MKDFDLRHLACPGPVLKLRDLLDEGEGEIRFHVADELCRSNVTRFAGSRGAEVSVEDPGDGTFFITVTAAEDSAGARPGEEALIEAGTPAVERPGRPLVVQVSSDTMGGGDDDLGVLLLRSFLKTQLQLEEKPDAVIFYNNGVKLCSEGSMLLDDLREIEAAGIEIIACGTCLNFFELSDRLAVGRVTDMLEIATRLAGAGRIVRP
jgi:selenium metabolism protein YedF